MEKVVMRGLLIALFVVGVTGLANATPVSPLTTATPSGAPAGTYGPQNQVAVPSSVSWVYSWTVPASFTSITNASLVVNHTSVDAAGGGWPAELHNVYLDNVLVGPLDYDLQTSFNLLPAFVAKLDGSINMRIDFFTLPNDFAGSRSTIGSAPFVITYDVPTTPPVPPVPGVIPAPAAIILGSLGTGLVGWLRRRGTV